jgi:RNA polymerase sigma-70 factor (ECF subfamily)
MQPGTDEISLVSSLLERARNGDDQARAELIECSCQRLLRLTRRMLHRQCPDLRRWEDTSDVLQQALLRLDRSLEKIKPESVRQFYRLAGQQIRWELIDLCRHHFGPQGVGAHYQSDCGDRAANPGGQRGHEAADDTAGPAGLMEWTEFHEHVDALPDQEREVFDLLWYQQLSQQDAAAVLGVSVGTVKLRWQRAKLKLHKACDGRPPA